MVGFCHVGNMPASHEYDDGEDDDVDDGEDDDGDDGEDDDDSDYLNFRRNGIVVSTT